MNGHWKRVEEEILVKTMWVASLHVESISKCVSGSVCLCVWTRKWPTWGAVAPLTSDSGLNFYYLIDCWVVLPSTKQTRLQPGLVEWGSKVEPDVMEVVRTLSVAGWWLTWWLSWSTSACWSDPQESLMILVKSWLLWVHIATRWPT